MYNLRVVVEEVKGFCDLPMRPGDYFEVRGGKIIIPPGKHMCLWALQSLLPMLPLKQRRIDEENDWVPDTKRMCCPDPNGLVIYRIDVLGTEDEAARQVKPRLLVDETKCSGCRACELACSFAHEQVFSPNRARLQVAKDDSTGLDRPQVCRQCGTAPCVTACPSGALQRDAATKAVLVARDKCVGCCQCQRACAFGAIRFDGENKPVICDLCGGAPACVRKCPTGALAFGVKGGVK